MSKRDSKVDAYIEKSQPFAQPVIEYIREVIHEYCPDTEEAIKWGFPHFTYQGKNLCSVAAFKQHCSFGFWLESQMKTMKNLTKDIEKNSMFTLGKITKIEDLPSKSQLKKCIEEAMELAEMGVVIKRNVSEQKELEVPEAFQKVLNQNKKAKKVFEDKTPGYRKEYITWITEAKTEATRDKRIAQAVEWIEEGKTRNWKYERK